MSYSVSDKRYYNKNKEKIKLQYGYAHLKKLYGIDRAAYDAILDVQNGVCAICGTTPEENGKKLAVDHNHTTGKIRGILCSKCNSGVGYFRDSPHLMEQAKQYIIDRDT